MAANAAPVRTPRAAPQLAEVLLGRQWHIIPERLTAMRAATERLLANPSALTAWADAQVPETYLTTSKDGIATLQIRGVLERSWSFWCWLFGGTAYEVIGADLERLRDDPAIRAVICEYDTGGGDVSGCGETAEIIRSVSLIKPVVSHAAGCCASAGYYLGSAGTVFVADSAAIIGSIGTCAAFADFTKAYEDLGIQIIEMVSTQSPRKNADPFTKEGYADWLALLDSLAAVFIADVATYRDVDEDTVLSDFGQGAVFVGQEAVDAGLADALGTHARIHAALLAELDNSPTGFSSKSFTERLTMSVKATARRGTPASSVDPATPLASEPKKDDVIDDAAAASAGAKQVLEIQPPPHLTAAWLKEYAPDVAAELQGEGAASERERIAAIQKLGAKVKGPKAEQAIAAAIADPAATAQSLAHQLIEGGALAGQAALDARNADETQLDPPSNADGSAGAMSEDDRAVHMILNAGKRPAKATR